MQLKILSVSEVTQYIKRILTNDPILYNLRVRGEISNLKPHSSGHLYFTLKDGTSRISCVMFRSHAATLKCEVENGMKVKLKGAVSVYERDGQYQLYVSELEPDGVGSLYTEFLALKARLEKEGLFDPAHKKPLPSLPRTIALITSPTGAAIRDLISVIRRRFPKVNLLLFPTLVQGEVAASMIAESIERANRHGEIDLIILGRGGGSIEELWAFNEEVVARAIYHSTIPIISAVGHETDFTIADFVADLRAPTPSAAGELAVSVLEDLSRTLFNHYLRMKGQLQWRLEREWQALKRIAASYSFRYPYNRLYDHQQELDQTLDSLLRLGKRQLEEKQQRLLHLGDKLNALSPLGTLKRGYSLVKDGRGRLLRSVEGVQPGDQLEITLEQGALTCVVNEIYKEGDPFEKEEI